MNRQCLLKLGGIHLLVKTFLQFLPDIENQRLDFFPGLRTLEF